MPNCLKSVHLNLIEILLQKEVVWLFFFFSNVCCGGSFFVLQNLWPKCRPKIGSLISNSILNYTANNEIEPRGCTQHIAEMRLLFFFLHFGGHLHKSDVCLVSVRILGRILQIICCVSHKIPGFGLTTCAASTSMCSRSRNVIARLSSRCKQIIRSKPPRFA